MNRGDGAAGAHRHHRAEIARSLPEQEVAPTVATLGLDQCDVTVDRVLQHVQPSVDLAGFLAPGQFGSVAGGCEESTDAGAGGADALGQVALRNQFEFELATAVKGVEHVAVGLPRKTADDLAHAAGLEQRRQSGVTVAGIVVDHGKVLRALLDQPVDQFIGNAGGAEAADEDGRSILDAG